MPRIVRSFEGNDGWMQFPERCHLRRAARVWVVLECETKNVGRERRINFLSCVVHDYAVRVQLGSKTSARGAVAIHVRRLDDDAWSALVRGGCDFHVNIAVAPHQARELHESSGDVVEVVLAPGAWSIEGRLRRNEGKVEEISDSDFDGSILRQNHVLGCSSVVFGSGRARSAIAKIGLRRSNTATAA